MIVVSLFFITFVKQFMKTIIGLNIFQDFDKLIYDLQVELCFNNHRAYDHLKEVKSRLKFYTEVLINYYEIKRIEKYLLSEFQNSRLLTKSDKDSVKMIIREWKLNELLK
jgi:hypothetical protein